MLYLFVKLPTEAYTFIYLYLRYVYFNSYNLYFIIENIIKKGIFTDYILVNSDTTLIIFIDYFSKV